MNYYTNVDSLKNLYLGERLSINKTLANSLVRTGKQARSEINWANIHAAKAS